jgi:ubiquinone/menaquinone biosynthesis C-methylase UbiE
MAASDPILEHYAEFDEDTRLSGAFGEFECARTRELIARHLPALPAEIIDVGGGTGAHAFWLAGLGHRVHLVDLVPRHIDIAAAQQATHGPALASATVGDARRLGFPDGSADLIVLAGPLYHLIERQERLRALRESHRVLRRGGVLLSVAINRYAGVIYGLTQGLVFEQDYFDMTIRELGTGVRSRPPAGMKTFREAYFHLPIGLVEELSSAGFACEPCLGVVGPAWQVPNLTEAWADAHKRDTLLSLARALERECILSPQLFCAARP